MSSPFSNNLYQAVDELVEWITENHPPLAGISHVFWYYTHSFNKLYGSYNLLYEERLEELRFRIEKYSRTDEKDYLLAGFCLQKSGIDLLICCKGSGFEIKNIAPFWQDLPVSSSEEVLKWGKQVQEALVQMEEEWGVAVLEHHMKMDTQGYRSMIEARLPTLADEIHAIHLISNYVIEKRYPEVGALMAIIHFHTSKDPVAFIQGFSLVRS